MKRKKNGHGLRQVKLVPVGDLKVYGRNSRTHTADQVNQIMASIQEFGFTNPVLIDEKGTIIAGEGRYHAAVRLGHKAIPCITLTGLTAAQKRAYVIADNKLALNAGWNETLLSLEIEELRDMKFDTSILGFSEAEIQKLSPAEEINTAELPKAIQLEPPREYAVIICDGIDEWERLKVALKLTPVRRGGYKRGSQFDAVGTQRVVRAADVLPVLEAAR